MSDRGSTSAPGVAHGWPLVEWHAGDAHGRLTVFPGPGVVVGRHADTDLTLDLPGISRRHALLVCEPDRWLKVVDLHSGNGTFVNGERVHVAMLGEGDVVRLAGSVALRIHYPHSSWPKASWRSVARTIARWLGA